MCEFVCERVNAYVCVRKACVLCECVSICEYAYMSVRACV